MVNSTIPLARQNRQLLPDTILLREAEDRARRLIGKQRRQTDDALEVAENALDAAQGAQASADDAQTDATAALAAVATKLGKAATVTIATDDDELFSPPGDNTIVFHTGTLTVLRTITLDDADAGTQVRFVRTGAGAFPLSIDSLKDLATGEWCDVYSTGAAWLLTAYGTL